MLTREELADALKAATDADAEHVGTAADAFFAKLRSLGYVRVTDELVRRAISEGWAAYREKKRYYGSMSTLGPMDCYDAVIGATAHAFCKAAKKEQRG